MKKTFIIVSQEGGTLDLFVVCAQRRFGLSDCQLQGVHWFSYLFQGFDDGFHIWRWDEQLWRVCVVDDVGDLVCNGECHFSVVQTVKKTFIIVSIKGKGWTFSSYVSALFRQSKCSMVLWLHQFPMRQGRFRLQGSAMPKGSRTLIWFTNQWETKVFFPFWGVGIASAIAVLHGALMVSAFHAEGTI